MFSSVGYHSIFIAQLCPTGGQSVYGNSVLDREKNGLQGLPYDIKPARPYQPQQRIPYIRRIPLGRYQPPRPQWLPVDLRPPATGVPHVPIPRPPTTRSPAKGLPPVRRPYTFPPPVTQRPWTQRSYTFPPREGETRPPAKGVPPFTPAPWASTTPPLLPPPTYGTRRTYLRYTVRPAPPGFSPPSVYVPAHPLRPSRPYGPPPVPPSQYGPPNYPPYVPPVTRPPPYVYPTSVPPRIPTATKLPLTEMTTPGSSSTKKRTLPPRKLLTTPIISTFSQSVTHPTTLPSTKKPGTPSSISISATPRKPVSPGTVLIPNRLRGIKKEFAH